MFPEPCIVGTMGTNCLDNLYYPTSQQGGMGFQQTQPDIMQAATEDMSWYDSRPPEFVFTCSWQAVLAEPAVANL